MVRYDYDGSRSTTFFRDELDRFTRNTVERADPGDPTAGRKNADQKDEKFLSGWIDDHVVLFGGWRFLRTSSDDVMSDVMMT